MHAKQVASARKGSRGEAWIESRNEPAAHRLLRQTHMPDEARKDGSDDNAPDTQSDAADAESQRTIRERVTQLAFGGNPSSFDEFLRVVSEATPDGVQVILRGSAVTGHKWASDEPFDADGPGTSDLDVTFVGGDMVSLFRDFHIPGIHSVPLSEQHPYASSALGPLRQRLCAMTKRPVNLQATTSLVQYIRDVVMDQPYLVLLEKPEVEEVEG